jgi:CheY-like chemotaxis protein
MLSALGEALRRKGHTVETASNGIDAASKLENTAVQAVITDLRMPGMDGLELLHHVRRTKPAVPVIVLSAHGTVPTAVDAIKAGGLHGKAGTDDHDRTAVHDYPDRIHRALPVLPAAGAKRPCFRTGPRSARALLEWFPGCPATDSRR